MAEITTKIEVKLQDLDCFKVLVEALAKWAEEIKDESYMSEAERGLLESCCGLDLDGLVWTPLKTGKHDPIFGTVAKTK